MRFPISFWLVPVFVALGLFTVPGYAQDVATSGSNAVQVLKDNPAVAAGSVEATPDRDAKSTDLLSQYVIGAADVIHINVWKNADLSQTLTVDPDGFVSIPLLGDVHVAGMTTNQLGAILASRYKSYVVSPQVTVSVIDIRSRQVYVMGQVGKAGGYPLIAPITVLQLIAQAGGLNTYAKRKGIYVLRAKNGGTEKLPFNYVNVTHGDGKQNIVLQPGDTVIVP
jgi:polysaccharide export outer membrane protein